MALALCPEVDLLISGSASVGCRARGTVTTNTEEENVNNTEQNKKEKKNLNSPLSKAVQLLLNGNIKAFSFSPSYIQVTQTTLYGVDTGVACRV